MRRPERASSSRSETAASRSPFNLMPSVAASTTSRAPTTGRAAGCLGNCDARVDYEVLEWPPTNGVAVTLNLWFTSSPAFSIDRESKAIEQYATWHEPTRHTSATTDVHGSLRMRRVGNTVSMLSQSGG